MQELYDFLDASITAQTSPEEGYRKFDALAGKHVDVLRKLTKKIQDARLNHDADSTRDAMHDYEEALDKCAPFPFEANFLVDIADDPVFCAVAQVHSCSHGHGSHLLGRGEFRDGWHR